MSTIILLIGAFDVKGEEYGFVKRQVVCLCHGGPISMPDDAEYVLKNTEGVHGFYGASSMERLPTEIAITQQMKEFKAIQF